MEPVSPELVLVCPELRLHAPYGPYVPKRPQHVEPLGTGAKPAPRDRVELTVRLPVVAVALAGTVAKTLLQVAVVVLGAAVLVAFLVLLARL
jgi:hypothetical protein